MSEEKVLTREIAEQRILVDEYSVDFSEFTSIEDDAAESLSKYEGDLYLSGVTELSDAAAKSLSNCWSLSLGGLTQLSEVVGESLTKIEGVLSLNGLTHLSEAAAQSLSKYRGRVLDLNNLTQLSDVVAESLSNCKAEHLKLNGLNELSDAAAESLSKYDGRLSLNGVTELSGTAAGNLSECNSQLLSLNGLTTISDEAAEILCRYSGQLSLGFIVISESLAATLCQCSCASLALPFVLNLSDTQSHYAVAKLIAEKAEEEEDLGLNSLHVNEELVDILSKSKGWWCAEENDSLRDISESLAKKIAGMPCFSEETGDTNMVPAWVWARSGLRVLTEQNFLEKPEDYHYSIDVSGAEYLASEMGDIDLPNIKSISDDVAACFSNVEDECNGWGIELWGVEEISAKAVGCLCQSISNDFALGLTVLSPDVADSLLMFTGQRLTLDSLNEISDSVAYTISCSECECLRLRGIKQLSDTGADHLSRYRGRTLCLDGLTCVSDKAAASLGQYRGCLEINLDNLPASAAQILRDAGHGEE